MVTVPSMLHSENLVVTRSLTTLTDRKRAELSPDKNIALFFTESKEISSRDLSAMYELPKSPISIVIKRKTGY